MFYLLQFTKPSYNLDKLKKEIETEVALDAPNHLEYINASGNTLHLFFHQEPTQAQKESINTVVDNHIDDIPYKNIISSAMSFGQMIIIEFAAENISMGITQDNMTKIVRERTYDITQALLTGSLYDAIAEIKNFPAEKKDIKYITDERLLKFMNKIEAYLGIPLSTSLG